MRRLFITILILTTIACGAITRDEILQQKIIIKDSATKKPIANVVIKMNDNTIGRTDASGILVHNIANPNEEQSFQLTISHPQYTSISIPITSKAGGGYIAGGVALFLLGIIPGAVSLAVDGGTGTWYTYDKKIELFMSPK